MGVSGRKAFKALQLELFKFRDCLRCILIGVQVAVADKIRMHTGSPIFSFVEYVLSVIRKSLCFYESVIIVDRISDYSVKSLRTLIKMSSFPCIQAYKDYSQ